MKYSELAKTAFNLIMDYDDNFANTLEAKRVPNDSYINYIAGIYKDGYEGRMDNTTIHSIFGDELRIDVTDYIMDRRTGKGVEALPGVDTYEYRLNLSRAIKRYHTATDCEHMDVSVRVDGEEIELSDNDKLLLIKHGLSGTYHELTISTGLTFDFINEISTCGKNTLDDEDFIYGTIVEDSYDSVKYTWGGYEGVKDCQLHIDYTDNMFKLHEGRRTYKSLRKMHRTLGKVLGPNTEAFLNDLLADLESSIHAAIEDNNKGRFYLSIHPLDFLTMSTNNCGWRSCLALDGEYSYGSISSYEHPEFIMLYQTTSKEREFIGGVHDKTFRQLFYVNDSGVAHGAPYPNRKMEVESLTLELLSTFYKDKLTPAFWSEDNEISCMYDDLSCSNDRNALTINGDDFCLMPLYSEDYFGYEFMEAEGNGMFVNYLCSDGCGEWDWDCRCYEYCNECELEVKECVCDEE